MRRDWPGDGLAIGSVIKGEGDWSGDGPALGRLIWRGVGWEMGWLLED